MLQVNSLSMIFPDKKLFEDVDLVFSPGNCYGIIGANGAGKTTFLKILSGEKEPTKGSVTMDKNARMSKLKQDHYAYEDQVVLDLVIMGNKKLYDIAKAKEAIYMKADFSDQDGMKAAQLEADFAEMGGYEAEAEAATLLQGLGIDVSKHQMLMADLKEADKIKVLLAQALFDSPDILLLDEPTNGLDIKAILWLQDFLMDFPGIVIVVSHDRYFLNEVCTMTVDVDFGKITLFVGNYDFWYHSSQLALKMAKEQNRKKEEKAKELKDFIARFSANKSKARQATSRRKLLEKISLDDIKPSTRRYPFVGFPLSREPGNDILIVDNLSIKDDQKKLIDSLSFIVNKNDKIAFIGNDLAISKLFEVLNGKTTDYQGSFKFGQTISKDYFPKDNKEYFQDLDLNLIDWMRQYSEEQSEIEMRGYLGKMLFSGDQALKKANVLSGGERVRMMFLKMMVQPSNLLFFDQMTNHLDLESIEAVNKGLEAYKGNLLFSSHDSQIISTVANRIIEIFEDGTYRDEEISYQDYIDKYYKEDK
ncbi:MAG: ATP-binding cassette domain-containing protein [Bacillota bacterium]|nr:ATP-binding cassette domain-containing protein [Bacillota bacterium]